MTRASRLCLAALTFAASGLALLPSHDAEACGGFFTPAMVDGPRRPSLSYEQVLLVHDPRAGKEHFIREVTFDRANETFGFVVPTPTRPEVAKVNKSPFVALRQNYPFAHQGNGMGRGESGGSMEAAAPNRHAVQVLETKQVGSFTAFVLQADDGAALAGWLRTNGLSSTPEADKWLAHYVALKFFYVAMRYDGKPGAAPKLTSETVRISFATPAPYYPYFEPARPKGVAALPARLVDLWVVSTDPVVPICLHSVGTTREWVRPMREGLSTIFDPAKLDPALLALFPSGPTWVQAFEDQKVSRTGYGDIVFAPAKATPPDEREGFATKLGPLLNALTADTIVQKQEP